MRSYARLLVPGSLLIIAVVSAACSSTGDDASLKSATDGTTPRFGDASSDGGADISAASCKANQGGGDPDKDYDGDGFPLKYDCNECDVNTNKGAFDVPGNGIDEDCSGKADDEVTQCDDDLALEGTDAFDGAKAMGLCKRATDSQMWGVLKAEWVLPDGSPQVEPLSEGILSKFGVNPPIAGKRMLAISSGSARDPKDPGYQDVKGWWKDVGNQGGSGRPHGTPAGYPKASTSCIFGGNDFGPAYDGAALRVTVRVPTNAKSFSFQQNFFTYEFPDYICSVYNDFFVTMMSPKPSTLADGNIAFDQDKNPISVNASFLQVCRAQIAGLKPFACPLGDATLSGTGFDYHAATGWLTTTAPVEEIRGKEMTLLWAIWDQGDGYLDSTALIDDFAWSAVPAAAPSTKPSVVK